MSAKMTKTQCARCGQMFNDSIKQAIKELKPLKLADRIYCNKCVKEIYKRCE